MKVNVDKLTMREVIDVEDKAGMAFGEVLKTMPTKGLVAIVWVIRRRENPEFSWDNALDLDFESVDAVFEKAASNGFGYDDEADAVDPTEPTDEEPGST